MVNLREYRKRLDSHSVNNFNLSKLNGLLGKDNLKFNPNGSVKLFYGTTCITRISQPSNIYNNIMDFQQRLQSELTHRQFDDCFSFLDPKSWHMTICDITAQSQPLQMNTMHEHIHNTKAAFGSFNHIKPVQAHLSGLGMDCGLFIPVLFHTDSELEKILYMETIIKRLNAVNARNFLGHINIAYFVKSPNQRYSELRKLLSQFNDNNQCEFSFMKLELAYFKDMNNYHPLLTCDLSCGEILEYEYPVLE